MPDLSAVERSALQELSTSCTNTRARIDESTFPFWALATRGLVVAHAVDAYYPNEEPRLRWSITTTGVAALANGGGDHA